MELSSKALLFLFLFIFIFLIKSVNATPTTVSFQISASHDDAGAWWNPSGWYHNWELERSQFSPGHFSPEGDGTYYYGGVRFINVNIPQGATIVSAILRHCADTSCEGPGARWYIYGQDDSNPVEFSTLDDFLSRPKTTAVVDTGFWPAWVAGTWYEAPDISAVIQEVVNRPDWSSDNSLALLLYGHPDGTTTHEIRTYDANPAEATILEVEYTTEEDEEEYAEYNSTLGAPDCHGGSPCIANSSLLQCCGNQVGGPEPNQPNTINDDTDASSGTCHNDESVENITVESLDNNYIGQGDQVRVDVTIHCWGTTDRWAICYTNDSSTADWNIVAGGSSVCSGGGFETKIVTFNLDNVGGKHAVRGIIRYNTDIPVCSYSDLSYNEFDDLAFEIYTGGAPPDTTVPTYSNLHQTIANNTAVNTGTSITFGAQWTDNSQLSMYVNSSKINDTGAWTNGTWHSFSIGNWSNFTINFPAEVGSNITVKIYANDTSNNQNVIGVWFWYNVTPLLADETPPTYSDGSTNSTLLGSPVEFRLTMDDETALDPGGQYIFGIDNCTGSFIEDSPVNFISTPQTVTIVKTINETEGCTIRWYYNFSDDSGNWNDALVSNSFSFVTTSTLPAGCTAILKPGEMIEVIIDVPPASTPVCNKDLEISIGGITLKEEIEC